MTKAAAHSHHSLRSIRRKLARSAPAFLSSRLPTAFELCRRNDDPFPAHFVQSTAWFWLI